MSEGVVGEVLAGIVNMATDNTKTKEFIRRLMVAKCSEGTMDYQYLNLPLDHGVYFFDTEQPLMNACDYKGGKHVLQFGRCKSSCNPKNAISQGIDKIVSNPLVKMVCPVATVIDAVGEVKEKLGGEYCKCSPKTIKVWEETNEGNCMDGADGILDTSHLTCYYGGIITITQIPENGNGDGTSGQDTVTKKTVMERMPQSVAESINNMNAEAQSTEQTTESSSTTQGQTSGASSGSGSGSGGSSAGNGASMGECSGGTDNTQEMEAQMQNWYEQAEDFEQNYGVTGEMMLSNYANNRCQEIPQSALNEEGYICDMSELSQFRMGGASVALIGTGCVSAYNAMHALGATQPLSDVIMAAEMQQTVPGYINQGPMEVSMMSTAVMFQGMGCKTTALTAEDLLGTGMKKGTVRENSVAIVGKTGTDGKPQFHTLKADSNGKLCCMENRKLSTEKIVSKTSKTQFILGVSST